jgi:hypothetical protein
MKKNNNVLKLVIITICLIFISASFSQAMVKTKTSISQKESYKHNQYEPTSLGDPIYEWKDDFSSEQKIDSTMSHDYEIVGGKAQIKSTFPIWTDPNWKCMKPITVKNNVGTPLENYAVKVIVTYDSDMDPNYHDLRFKHANNPTQWLDYWIEKYDTTSATVWVNIPSIPTGESKMYMFYGNPSAPSQSDFYAVFSDWDEEWENDLKVSVHLPEEGAWDPDVAYGNGRYLVAWEEGFPFFPYKQDIRGSIYDNDGNPIIEDFTIRTGTGVQWHHENPSAAYGGGKFFVAWEHYETSSDPSTMSIIGRFVDLNGGVSSSDIKICQEPLIQADPNVCFDNKNNRFLVVWEDCRLGYGNYNIYGKLYDTNGNQIGNEKIISAAANSQCEPWVAFDPINQQYMIVFEEGANAATGPFDIWVGLFDKDLNCIGPGTGSYKPIKLTSSNEGTDYNFPCVSFCEQNQRFLITYNDGDISSNHWYGNVWGTVLDSSGNIKVDTFLIRNGHFVRTEIAPYLSTNFLVSFNGGEKIWGRFVSSQDGTIYNGDIPLSASTSAVADWSNMATDGDQIFVAWEDARVSGDGGIPDVYANLWHLNIGDSEVTCTVGTEQNLILTARVTSIIIVPENLFKWLDFLSVSDGTISFDILDAAGNPITGYQDINSGKDLSGLSAKEIRLRADFSRTNPSYSPTLDEWKVRYYGKDEEPPRTSIDRIEGTKGLNDWYIEESVTIWLYAQDYPEKTGSGVKETKYTLNGGTAQTYNQEGGIHLVATQQSSWTGQWEVNFWSIDIAGNIENKNKQENKINIKIDAEKPYVEIKEPANEQEVAVPFWVRADARDNTEIDYVAFDIEPFGKRDGFPIKVYQPNPDNGLYEWYCDVKQGKQKSLFLDNNPQPQTTGVNVMVRAQVYDKSGQTWIHEVWVYITNWKKDIIRYNPFMLAFSQDLTIETPVPTDADTVKFVATKIFTGKQTIIWDYDLSDGCSAVFDIPTGFYRITTYAYKEDTVVASDIITRVLYFSR